MTISVGWPLLGATPPFSHRLIRVLALPAGGTSSPV